MYWYMDIFIMVKYFGGFFCFKKKIKVNFLDCYYCINLLGLLFMYELNFLIVILFF